jgi:putative ABC transport system permease protein
MLNDVRYAVRSFLKTPGLTAVMLVTLALGIGTNTAIFSIVYGVLLRPLPYPRPDDLVQIWNTSRDEPQGAFAAADFLELQHDNRSLARLAGYREDAYTLAVTGREPVRISGALVTVDFFDVLGVPAALGRTFSRAADGGTAEPLVVLSDEAWRQHFAADPTVVNTRVRVNGVPHTVVGVLPAAVGYPGEAQAWVLSSKPVPVPPIDVAGDLLASRGVHYIKAVGRLRPGVTAQQGQQDLAAIAAQQASRFAESNEGRGIAVRRLRDEIVGDVRAPLLLLLGAVGLVLLIACANVASLLLARASTRQREIAIRAALGAQRARLARQLITESLVLGAAGGAGGLLVGSWALTLLLKVIPAGIPRVQQVGLDMRVAAAAIAASLASALLFGVVPALQGSRTDGIRALRDSDRATTAGRARAHARAVLVVGEIALTLVLLVLAGLLGNSLLRLENVDPGFSPEHVTLVTLPLPQAAYPDGKRQAAFYQRILEGVEQKPQIESAAILFPSPINGGNASGTFVVEGREISSRVDKPFAAIGSVSPKYFRTLGIPLIQGRTFNEQDREPAPEVAIVNTTLVRKYLGGREAIGSRIRFGDPDEGWITIVGVVGDSRNLGLGKDPAPLVYIPYHRFPLPFMSLVIRSSAAPAAIASLVRAEVRNADPDLPVDDITPLRDVLRESVAEPRFRALLVAAFAAMAVILAGVGVYGLISYSVTQRTREIGIRMALGARARQVVLPVVGDGMMLAVTGIGIGLVGSFVASQALARFLFGVGATDPLTYGAVAIFLLAVALLASYVPSRRVLRIDPLVALRAD